MDNYAQKIAKLLTKAEGTDNPEEAAAYTEMAERWMVKWGIEEAVARAHMQKKAVRAEEIIVEELDYDGRFAPADVLFGHCVCRGLGNLRTIQVDKRSFEGTITLRIVGHASDVARALWLATSLQLQAAVAMDVWYKEARKYELRHLSQHEKFKAKRQFLISFAHTCEDRLTEMRKSAIEETSDTKGTELVLLDRKTLVDNRVSEMYPNLGKARGMAGSMFGQAAGKQAGNRANIGQKATPTRRQIG